MQPLIVAEHVRQGIADFLATSFPGTTPGFDGLTQRFLSEPGNVARGPYVTISLPFRKMGPGSVPFEWLKGFDPHAHQARAFARLSGDAPLSTLVATGTGSGKTECFLYPVLEHCRKMRAAGRRGVKAILIYPMNALATDQANRVAKEIVTRAELHGLTAGLYVGDESDEKSTTVRHLDGDRYTVITDRERIREEPPDILLTNYKMLDFLLIRARDSVLWRHNGPDTLRFLVVDELHTFDGAQGTDLACLVRRLKARLKMPPGTLACVGTSATLGTDGSSDLLRFARDVFAEGFDDHAIISEDRETVAEYLQDSVVDHVLMPGAADYATLSPLAYASAADYLAAQYALWFGEDVSAATFETPVFQLELGHKLKQHVAFQNLLRDLHRFGGRAVSMELLADTLGKRLRDIRQAPDDFPERWLLSLIALVAAAASDLRQGKRVPFLWVRVELWLRELRRMVADISTTPRLWHSDDLPAQGDAVYLPPVHCRDCHAMGWGATQTKTDGAKLVPDLRAFYAAFFSGDVSVRFVFPTTPDAPCNARKFERRQLCAACGTLNQVGNTECAHCGSKTLVLADVATNQVRGRRNGANFVRSTNDCPFCEGERTLTIVGSQAASLASVAVGQLFGSRYNADKKLIAFSDSVQDAAHRAGFFEARTWRFNLRPAMAQVITEAVASGQRLTLASLPRAFATRWRDSRGPREYVKTFLPPVLSWMQDYERLLADDGVQPTKFLLDKLGLGLTWAMLGEFGQDAHIGRTLPRTHTACVDFDGAALQQASDHALESLREKVDALRGLDAPTARTFLLGVLARLLRLGAIWDPSLHAYARGGCNIYVYSGNKAEFALLKTPRRPRYLSLQEHGKSDAVTGDSADFYRDWAFRALPGLNAETFVDASIVAEIYRIALQALAAAGITEPLDTDKTGVQVWGLKAEACSLTTDVAEWRCKSCRHTAITPISLDLTGSCCRLVGCQGQYGAVEKPDVQFYRQLYLTSDPWRIVAREHTGLLSRAKREQTENDFKDDRINVLSATPTLEMGIDIGDLSATLLCSTPPAQANYLQRVGRAGRKTGNAFAATFTAGRPHDLYFWADPREMMAGSVDAPGVFINASAVLERQLTAFSLDTWVQAHGDASRIPRNLGEVLSAVRNSTQAKFPYPWLSYVEKNRATILAHFLELFLGEGTQLSEQSTNYLEQFIQGGVDTKGSLAWRLVNRLLAIANDVEDLKKRRKKIDDEFARVDALPVKAESDLVELAELKTERSALTRLMAAIGDRDTLQFLTDEGLLPNYAFPEQGVLLQSVIIRDDRADQSGDEQRILTFEYERPGASAITELAPNSVFYAEGRHVTIDQVDVSRDKPSRWRFCRACSYSEEQAGQSLQETCPRCGDALWPDGGRVQTMLRLSKVYARTADSRSRIGDDADDRETRFFVRQALIDVAPDAIRQAWAMEAEDFPFAFEFVDDIRFREVNFGEQNGGGQALMVAGDDTPKPGFSICPECGTLQRQRRNPDDAWRNHALYCSKRKQPESATQECLFLYREFDSEGIRLYLPDSLFADSDQSVHSFIAAVQMGLELKFRGAVDHLRIARDVRMASGQESPRQYLVIYDSVPGGTGYLKELMRDAAPLFEIFELAAQRLATCACNSDESKDGCYQCLYGYHNSYDRRQVSRRTAAKILARIAEQKTTLKAVGSINEVTPNNSLFDSELERRFIEALRRRPVDGSIRFEVREELVRGAKPGYLLTAGESLWSIEPQVDLGPTQGVVIPCRPDFVLWPENTRQRPIAVFLDGWKYHKDRIGDDIAKRMAVARSGKFDVWTLTADDVAMVLDTGARPPETVWPSLFVNGNQNAGPIHERFGVSQLTDFHARTAFEQLRLVLLGMSDEKRLRLAVVLALRVGVTPTAYDAASLSQIMNSPACTILEQTSCFELKSAPDLGRVWTSALGGLQLAAQASKADLGMLSSSPENRNLQPLLLMRWGDVTAIADADQRRLWQQLWHAANLLLPMANYWLVADEACNLSPLASSPFFDVRTESSREWTEACELVHSSLAGLLSRLSLKVDQAPIIGHELMDSSGCVVAEAEAAWPDQRAAIVMTQDLAQPFTGAGWRVVVADADSIESLLEEILLGATETQA
ncbi:DEAD/DEAH box helicase [Hydrocarboniphaga effusa]|uniref:DEAD/DEAH box helicase n=1 Tax=Hydrocarboniphaga effusa TaxID=243629 RepID=UPI003BA97512